MCFRSGSNYKLKYRIRICELWTAACLDDVCELPKSTDDSFVIGWPTTNFVATFRWVSRTDKRISYCHRTIFDAMFICFTVIRNPKSCGTMFCWSELTQYFILWVVPGSWRNITMLQIPVCLLSTTRVKIMTWCQRPVIYSPGLNLIPAHSHPEHRGSIPLITSQCICDVTPLLIFLLCCNFDFHQLQSFFCEIRYAWRSVYAWSFRKLVQHWIILLSRVWRLAGRGPNAEHFIVESGPNKSQKSSIL